MSDETPLEDVLLAERGGLERRALDALIELDLNDDPAEGAMEALGVRFRNPELLRLALVHRSYLNERGVDSLEAITQSNERLEFLGDALLGMFTAEYLYKRFPTWPEGALTSARVSLVRTETLAEWAERYRLRDFTYLARGELGPNGEIRARLLAGSSRRYSPRIYLDRGIAAAGASCARCSSRTPDHRRRRADQLQGRLQELIQNRRRATPGLSDASRKRAQPTTASSSSKSSSRRCARAAAAGRASAPPSRPRRAMRSSVWPPTGSRRAGWRGLYDATDASSRATPTRPGRTRGAATTSASRSGARRS